MYNFDVELKLEGMKTVVPLPFYALEPLLWEMILLSGGRGEVEIVPLYPPEAFEEELALRPVSALLGRERRSETRMIYTLSNDAITGAVADLIAREFPLADKNAPVRYSLYARPEEQLKLSYKPLEEYPLSEVKLRARSSLLPGLIPKVFSSDAWDHLLAHALSDTTREVMAALRTKFLWDPASRSPWIYVYECVPFRKGIIADEISVKVEGIGMSEIAGESVSLFHTHITDAEHIDVAFFSQEDFLTMRYHLRRGQFSLVANILKGRSDEPLRFHLYGWNRGNIVREGFYLEERR